MICHESDSDDKVIIERAERIFFEKIKEYNKIIGTAGHPTRFVRLDDSHVMIIGWSHGWTHSVHEMEDEFTDGFAQLLSGDKQQQGANDERV